MSLNELMELRNRVNYCLELYAFMSTLEYYHLKSSANTTLASRMPHLVTWREYTSLNKLMELRNRVNYCLEL